LGFERFRLIVRAQGVDHHRDIAVHHCRQVVFGEADALFLPVLRFPVPTIAETDVRDGANMNEVLGSLNHCTWPINYLGLPGLAVPAGFSKSGLPVGFQLVGRPFAEATLFQIAAAYERETRWPDKVPAFGD
jgi:aspartyl-tRNA(Asn)/glutamyl-tRNA(Gln) amidotransferase subunit A